MNRLVVNVDLAGRLLHPFSIEIVFIRSGAAGVNIEHNISFGQGTVSLNQFLPGTVR